MKKANAILEYGILIIIVVVAVSGMYYFLKRQVQGYVRATTDTTLARPIPFLWQGGVNINVQNVTNDRKETLTGEIEEKSSVDATFTSITAPVPPYIDVAGLHVQDAPAGGSEQQSRNPFTKRERRQPDESAE